MNRIVKDLIIKYANENFSDVKTNEELQNVLTQFANDLLSIDLNMDYSQDKPTPPDMGICWDDGNF